MASGMLENVRHASGEARHALAERAERARAHVSPAGMALTVVGVAALAGLVVATVYFTPDFVRYLKIRNM